MDDSIFSTNFVSCYGAMNTVICKKVRATMVLKEGINCYVYYSITTILRYTQHVAMGLRKSMEDICIHLNYGCRKEKQMNPSLRICSEGFIFRF